MNCTRRASNPWKNVTDCHVVTKVVTLGARRHQSRSDVQQDNGSVVAAVVSASDLDSIGSLLDKSIRRASALALRLRTEDGGRETAASREAAGLCRAISGARGSVRAAVARAISSSNPEDETAMPAAHQTAYDIDADRSQDPTDNVSTARRTLEDGGESGRDERKNAGLKLEPPGRAEAIMLIEVPDAEGQLHMTTEAGNRVVEPVTGLVSSAGARESAGGVIGLSGAARTATGAATAASSQRCPACPPLASTTAMPPAAAEAVAVEAKSKIRPVHDLLVRPGRPSICPANEVVEAKEAAPADWHTPERERAKSEIAEVAASAEQSFEDAALRGDEKGGVVPEDSAGVEYLVADRNSSLVAGRRRVAARATPNARDNDARDLEEQLVAERRERQMAEMTATTLGRRAARAEMALSRAEERWRRRSKEACEENAALAGIIDKLEGVLLAQQDCISRRRGSLVARKKRQTTRASLPADDSRPVLRTTAPQHRHSVVGKGRERKEMSGEE